MHSGTNRDRGDGERENQVQEVLVEVERKVILSSRQVWKVLSDRVMLEQRGTGRNWENVTCGCQGEALRVRRKQQAGMS